MEQDYNNERERVRKMKGIKLLRHYDWRRELFLEALKDKYIEPERLSYLYQLNLIAEREILNRIS